MRRVFVVPVILLAACTWQPQGRVSIGAGGVRVSPSISATSGNARVLVGEAGTTLGVGF